MRICVVDGKAYYAKHLLRAKLPDGPIRFPACADGMLCFTDRDLDAAQAWLKGQGIEYEIEELPEPPGFEKTRGVRYSSRTEAIKHIRDGIEPESLTVVRLQERLQAAEEKAARVDLFENRLQSLEKAQKIAQEGEK